MALARSPFGTCRTLALVVGLVLSWPALADKGDRLDLEVLKRTKAATVQLRVTLPSGSVVEGSGFFGGEPGLVLTNAHVLGMLRPESPKPKKVEVIINSGERGERTLPGFVIGVDSGSDLGLLFVRDKNLPPPLIVDEKKALQETDAVFIFGFPFGKELGKNVTVSTSSISSLRKDPKGLVVQKIQVNGGMHPGNSGGPVILASGEVIGVSVSGIKSTSINFAVPARSVAYFLLGRRRQVVYGTAYKDGDKIKVPVHVDMVDPLRRVKEIWFDCWTGDPGKTREALLAKPVAMPGDSARQKCLLTYKDGVAEGEIILPANPPAKKVFWIQSLYTTRTNKTAWNSAIVYRPLPPVERKPAVLKHRHYPGAQATWKLNSTATFKIRDDEDQDHALSYNLATELQAATAEKLDRGLVSTVLRPGKLELSLAVDKKPVGDTKEDAGFAKESQLVTLLAQHKIDGSLSKASGNFRKVPRDSQETWKRVTDQMVVSLEAVSLALPGTEVTVGKPWTSTRPLTILIMGTSLPAVGEITYEYLGTRSRLGREEAVVQFKGNVHGPAGSRLNLAGKVRGEAWVDLATGQVILSKSILDVDMDLNFKKRVAKAGGVLEVRLERSVAAKKAAP